MDGLFGIITTFDVHREIIYSSFDLIWALPNVESDKTGGVVHADIARGVLIFNRYSDTSWGQVASLKVQDVESQLRSSMAKNPSQE